MRPRTIKCPPFPPILETITRALEDPNADDRDLRRAVRADEALTLSLLRYANSACMAQHRPAETADEALRVVGLAGLRSIILTDFAGAFFTRSGPTDEFLWEHAVASAIAMALQRPGAGRVTEDLYLCGLLHNIGKALLNAEDPGSYGEVVRRVLERGEDFWHAEEAVFGIAHPRAGAELLGPAPIPPIVKDVVRYHHNPERVPRAVSATCTMVLVADAVAYRASPAWETLRNGADEPPWIAPRVPRAPDGSPAGRFSTSADIVRLELHRFRSCFRPSR